MPSLFSLMTLIFSISLLSGCWSKSSTPGSGPVPATDLTRFLFITNESDDKISTFAFDNNFEQLRLVHQTLTADRPKSGIVDPSGRFYYVANANVDTISQYSISTDGSLKKIATDIPHGGSGFPQSLTVHPSGNFLYCVDNNKRISKFDIGTDGSLSDVTTIISTDETIDIVVHPNGNSAYVSNGTANTVSQYTIGVDGTLTAMTTPTVATGNDSASMVIEPGGQFLYIVNLGADSISQYSIAVDGSLTGISTAIATGSSPTALTIGPTQSFLYVTNLVSNTIGQYSITGDGSLAVHATPSVAVDKPVSISIDTKNQYAYVGTEITGVHIYDIGTDGVLSEAEHSPAPGLFGETIALTTGAALSAKPRHAYVTNGTTDNTVSQYDISSLGSLTAMGPPTVGASSDTMEITIHPTSLYAYVSANTNEVLQYDIATDGTLAAMATPSVTAGADVRAIIAEPSGRFVYAVNFGDNTVSQYVVNNTGELSPQTNVTVATGEAPISIAIHPSGLSAYVANFNDISTPGGGTISQYTIDTDINNAATFGNLIPMTTPEILSGNNPVSVAVHPSGKYVYAVNKNSNDFSNLTSTGDITMFTVNTDGSLAVSSPITIPVTGAGAIAIEVDPSGEYAYVTNAGDDTVSQFIINQSTGILSEKIISTVPTGTKPHAIHSDASGQFIYVSNITTEDISQYNIVSDGDLTIMSTPTVATGSNPRSIVSVVRYE